MGHPGGRFVKQQNAGFADQCTADFHAPAIDHGERCHRIEHTTGERLAEYFHEGVSLGHALFDLARKGCTTEQIGRDTMIEIAVVADHQVVENRQRQTKTRALKSPRDACPADCLWCGLRDVAAIDFHRTGR